MPEIPPAAIMAAATAIERELLSGRDYSMAQDSGEALARVALEAAAPILAGETTALQEKVRRQAFEIDHMRRVLERKNRELDALHLVWCDGGCGSGVHRWTDEKVTGELVKAAERNTARLRRWYDAVKWRLEHYRPGTETDLHGIIFRPSEWHEAYALRNARKTDLLPEVPDVP